MTLEELREACARVARGHAENCEHWADEAEMRPSEQAAWRSQAASARAIERGIGAIPLPEPSAGGDELRRQLADAECERDQLRENLTSARAVLARDDVQWGGSDFGGVSICPACELERWTRWTEKGERVYGDAVPGHHASDCPIGAELAKGGG